MADDKFAGYFRYLDRLHALAIAENVSCYAYFLESRFMLSGIEAETILNDWIAMRSYVILDMPATAALVRLLST